MRQLKLFLTALLVLTSSCASGPKVTVYISDPAQGGCEYFNPNTQQGGFVDYSLTDKFVCFQPAEAQALINFCGINDKQAISEARKMGFPEKFVSLIQHK